MADFGSQAAVWKRHVHYMCRYSDAFMKFCQQFPGGGDSSSSSSDPEGSAAARWLRNMYTTPAPEFVRFVWAYIDSKLDEYDTGDGFLDRRASDEITT